MENTDFTFQILILFASLILSILNIMVLWVIYDKAGQTGWACLVPIYNIIVLLKICERPAWWILLLMIPFVNLFATFILQIDLARVFGKRIGFAAGLIFFNLIFMAILAYGDAEYLPNSKSAYAAIPDYQTYP
jgi:hypothetical protein